MNNIINLLNPILMVSLLIKLAQPVSKFSSLKSHACATILSVTAFVDFRTSTNGGKKYKL